MEKCHSLISRRIQELVCKIEKQWGHKHLYKDYQVLVDALEMNSSLSEEELFALERLVGILLDEAKNYSRSYPKWSSRCLECASGLVVFLPSDFDKKENRVKTLMEMLTHFVTDPDMSVCMHMDCYGRFVKDVAENNVEIISEIASDCFKTASSGRRPWGIKDEIRFHNQMVEGYELATKYITLTGDFSHFPGWFSVLNPCRTDSLIEEVSAWIDRDENVNNLRWNNYSYEDVVGFLEHTLDMQYSLLSKWLDGDAEGFVSFWRAEKIEELLELVEDDVFFDVLRKLASLKNNPIVTKVLEFYAEDEEKQIKRFAVKLLEKYQ